MKEAYLRKGRLDNTLDIKRREVGWIGLAKPSLECLNFTSYRYSKVQPGAKPHKRSVVLLAQIQIDLPAAKVATDELRLWFSKSSFLLANTASFVKLAP